VIATAAKARRLARRASLVLAALTGGGCAGHTARPHDQPRPSPAAPLEAIRAARARFADAVTQPETMRMADLVTEDVELRGPARGVVVRGRPALAAYIAALGGPGAAGAILLQPRTAEACAHGGYEVGTYTRYRADAASGRVATFGGYALRWSVRDGQAVIEKIVVAGEDGFDAVPAGVACLPQSVVDQRSRRIEVTAAPVYSRWRATSSATVAAAASGWSTPPTRGAAAALGCLDGTKAVSLSDQTRLQLSARARLSSSLGARVVSVPIAVPGCMQAFNAGRQTVVSQSITATDHAALLEYALGGARVGAGLAYARVAFDAREDSVSSSWVRARARSHGGALGFAAQATYSVTRSSRLFAEGAARVRLTPSVAAGDRLLFYAPARISTAGYALSFGGGVAF
jgi:hypothetical protein